MRARAGAGPGDQNRHHHQLDFAKDFFFPLRFLKKIGTHKGLLNFCSFFRIRLFSLLKSFSNLFF